jgi:hypothetical protein
MKVPTTDCYCDDLPTVDEPFDDGTGFIAACCGANVYYVQPND